MDLAGLLVFSAAYLMAAASPGPGVAALLARVLAHGPRGSGPFIAGFAIGDLCWFLVAAAGLAVVAQSFAPLLVALKYAGACYLLYLAWKLWTAPPTPIARHSPAPAGGDSAARLFLLGLAIEISNPKPIVFFLALLPTVVDLTSLTLAGTAELAVLIAVILSSVLGAYVVAAARARRLFTSARAVRALNRGTGVAMAGAAVAVASR